MYRTMRTILRYAYCMYDSRALIMRSYNIELLHMIHIAYRTILTTMVSVVMDLCNLNKM